MAKNGLKMATVNNPITYHISILISSTKFPSNHVCGCMEHSVDLSAKTFVQTVSPSPA